MNRRRFLESAGLITAGGLIGVADRRDAMAETTLLPFLDQSQIFARNQNRSTVVCQHGIVCASQPLAAVAGMDILQSGGNCVDAAICTNAMLGLTEPASNGIGGDLFAIVWIEKDQRLYGLNASGRAPYDWNLEEASKRNLTSIPRESPLSWSVPGCVSGWAKLNERFGKLSLGDCLAPAIRYAREGFPLTPIIAEHFRFDAAKNPGLASIYHPDGRVPNYGDLFRNPQLAASYEMIAQDGAAAFYEGEIAERIVAKSKELGGLMSKRDLQDHEANWVDPVSSSYRGYDVWEIPPNGQGIAALQILNLLECFDIRSLEPNSADHLHLFIEAKKLVFEDRAKYYADPEFAEVPVDWLISKEYAKQRAKLIHPRQARNDFTHGDPALDSDTVYLTAADGEGNMISYIQSLYHGFGSTICPDGVGFSIQNRGQAFSLEPKHRNRLEPHKRPFHTIIPAFLTRNGNAVMPFGVMGGDFQPQGHAQVIMNMIDFEMSPQQAGESPRVAHEGSSSPWGTAGSGGEVVMERGFTQAVRDKLLSYGHRIRPEVIAHGGYQAIWRLDDPRRYFGGSDPRKDGMAVGY